MSTNYLFDTIYNVFQDELIGKYQAQTVRAVDTLITSRRSFSEIHQDSRSNTVENRSQFLNLFEEVNKAEPIPETLKAVNAYINALAAK